MSSKHDIQERRRFLRLVAGGTTLSILGGFFSRWARSDDLPHVVESDPTAKALGYVEDASTTTNAAHKVGDSCANCSFYSGKAAGYGACELFPGKAVSAKGWCLSHTPKT